MRARVLIRPKAGHPRPAGRRRRARAAGARLRRRGQRARRPARGARCGGRGAAGRHVSQAAGQSADRGLRDPGGLRVKLGVVTFPGTCDDADARLAVSKVAEPVALWHGDSDLQGVDGIVVPGGFSYGDYLRAGAIARFSPVMESVIAFANARRPGARHLQRLSDPLRGGAAAGRAAAQQGPPLRLPPGRPRGPDGRPRRSPPPARSGSACRSRPSTRPAASSATWPTSRSCCATPRATTSTAPRTTSPA